MREFVMNSKELCFLCLGKVGAQLNQLCPTEAREANKFSPPFSLLHLSRYLQLDLTKVFYEKGPIPHKLLKIVQQSEPKVDLCEECSKLNHTFSKLYRQLEKAEMEAAACLQQIHRKLLKSREGADGSHNILDGCNEADPKVIITNELRNETIEKCALKLKAVQPKVKVVKLSKKEAAMAAEKTKFRVRTGIPRLKQEKEYQQNEDSLIHPDNIKLESASFPVVDSDIDIDDENSYSDDLDLDHSSPAAVMLVEKKPNIRRTKRTKSQHPRNEPGSGGHPAVGKLQCRICKKEFAGANTMTIHYKNFHLKLKHKCNLCNMEFALKNSVIRHKKNVHEGIRFNCEKCNKHFAVKTNLRRHLMAEHFGKRFPCQYCNMTFRESRNRNKHMRARCPGKPPSVHN